MPHGEIVRPESTECHEFMCPLSFCGASNTTNVSFLELTSHSLLRLRGNLSYIEWRFFIASSIFFPCLN